MGDDHDLFAEAMGKVQAIKNSDKISLEKTKQKKKKLPLEIKQRQPNNSVTDSTAFASRRVQATRDPWTLIADGISRDNLKRLAAGRPPVGMSFDLHGMTRDASLTLLQDGIEQAMRDNIRALCIVHGRGLHSQDNKPILKHAVYHWLQEGPLAHLILAIMPQTGSGGGACLVLLRRRK